MKHKAAMLKWTKPHTLKQAIEYGRFAHMVNMLVAYGCGRKRAEQAITAALQRDPVPAHAYDQLLAWVGYCLSPEAESIKAKGYFIARRIEDGQEAPNLKSLQNERAQAGWMEAAGQPYSHLKEADDYGEPEDYLPRCEHGEWADCEHGCN